MALMDYVYNGQPFGSTEDRDEYFLIEVPGVFVPECDFIYYGLLASEYSDELVKLREQTVFDPHEIYNNHMYFTAVDLIRYLSSPDDTLDEMDADHLGELYVTALRNYGYNPANETMLRHAIIEAAMYDFVKKVCLVYPWGVRPIDMQFLATILPNRVYDKVMHFSGSLMDAIKNRPQNIPFYTTIISSSAADINDMIDHATEYETDQAFFMLRNHSENVKMELIPDPDNPGKEIVNFEEIGTQEILSKLMTDKGMPKGKMRFARFTPFLYDDRKPTNTRDFLLGT